MSVAAIYDIHGNLPALEAVLEEIDTLNVEQIVVGGDVIVGPMSRECLDALTTHHLPTHFIKGNCEVAVLDELNSRPPAPLPEAVIEDIRWTADQMDAEHQKLMEKWPLTFERKIGDLGSVLFCHATPRNENEIFTEATDEQLLKPIFENLDANIMVCGHTHMQFDRTVGNIQIVNAGSVGMPFGESGAFWLLLDSDVALMRTEYNLQYAVDQILKTTYPHAKDFAENNVMKCPTKETMLEVFKGAELKK